MRNRDSVWSPVNDQEALCHLAALSSPADRAVDAVAGLLNRFGSPTDIISASKHDLVKVTGVCEGMANTFKSVHSMFLGLLWKQLQNSNSAQCTIQISNWCREYLRSEEADVCLAVLYSQGEFCGVTPYAIGTKGHVTLYPREILKYALQCYTTSIVLVFSRKHGRSEMTEKESQSVGKLRNAADHLDIIISDVIVLAER